MMQCSGLFSPSVSPSVPQHFLVTFPNRCYFSVITPSRAGQLCLNGSEIHRSTLTSRQSTAMQKIVETSQNELEFVEIGYIHSVHGLQGEVRVKPSTDFPELRFSEPGRRWLRQQVSGKETIQEVELVEGRGHPGQKSWIVKFSNVDMVDQAQQLVGSTMLVLQEDRPELEEGELYTRDLVGMRVILKVTGEPVGTVVNVFNSGASDLLHVMLDSSIKIPDGTGKPKSELGSSGPLVWVPFVEAIVPIIDMNRREMLITPPRGLLELNIRSDERSKKERRQLEWKERKKFQKRLIAAKKKLHEMEQQHVFHGFRFGAKAQRSLLADQIVGVNSSLLQLALENIEMPSKRWNWSEFFRADLTKEMSTMKSSKKALANGRGELQEKGQFLTSKGKVAFVLVLNDSEKLGGGSVPNPNDGERTEDSSSLLVKALLSDHWRLPKIEERASVPLILVSPAHVIASLQKLFSSHDQFGFDSNKVWFLEEEKLPVVSSSPEEHKILMKSPWEILQTPVGSGGVISLFSSHCIIENLSELGVEYLEVCSVTQRSIVCPALLGLVDSCEANIGFQCFEEMGNYDEQFDIIFSMKFILQLKKQMHKLQFYAMPKVNSHVEMIDKKWVDINPPSPNSYELHCSIYSSLNICPPNKVCSLDVTE